MEIQVCTYGAARANRELKAKDAKSAQRIRFAALLFLALFWSLTILRYYPHDLGEVMSEMVERMAKAIFITRQEGLPKFTLRAQFDEIDEASGLKRRYLSEARAVLEALREPTKEMLQEGLNVSMEVSAAQLFHAYQAMIDAALK
jgi:hypothetical protein